MAILIPAIGSCASRMTSGERRLAERLEQKLDDDYLLWYDVPVGPRHLHPDFVVMHPRRGLLILEVKDWSPRTIQRADKQSWQVFMDGTLKTLPNPAEQARQYAHAVADALKRDPQLVHADGQRQGGLCFPWSYGVVFPNMTRKQFTEGQLDQVMAPHQVICSDEMLDKVDAEDLQSRLWGMFPFMMRGVMSLPQLDRVRWIMFPEVRVQTQGALFDDSDAEAELPSIMRVMDLQQEQLARSLGDGHRVIHGVAGSGKTMILGYRAEYLARAHTAASKPILILCYNEPLAVKLASVMQAKGLSARVHARHFHKWCRDQLVAFGQTLPAHNMPVSPKMDELVLRVIHGVDRKHIPSGQYQAVLIDEGHDFAPEWLRLVTQMVDPTTNSLLVLYDDAQSIYERARSKQFSFKSVGIQAQGRTTILKINYRNTRQILQTASLIAADLLTADDKDDDGIPLLKPISCGRDGQAPTYLLFLRMMQETGQEDRLVIHKAPKKGEPLVQMDGTRWADLMAASAPERLDLYKELLLAYGLHGQGSVQQIYANASTFITKPATLSKLVVEIDKLDWYSVQRDDLGDLYEGLLERNANEKKSGAGQYFTPRDLIDSIVTVMQPTLDDVIQDPASGTGGFLIAANNYLRAKYKPEDRSEAQQRKYRTSTFYGMELVQDTHRLALMNMLLHGIEGGIQFGDTLGEEGSHLPAATLCLSNPPFGTKKGGGLPTRTDFTYPTTNKQFCFLQHIYRNLKPGGRAAVVLPDNVLFESNVGADIRRDLMDKCNLHTLLRLPTGIFYAQGVKTNVLFFTRGKKDTGNTKEVWVYDMRANMPQFGKRTPFTRDYFRTAADAAPTVPRDKFEDVFGADPCGGPAALALRVDTGAGDTVPLFQALLSLELMHVFFQRDFLETYVKHLRTKGHWAAALNVLTMNGLREGNQNRFPLTWSDREAKIANMVDWTVTPEYPQGNRRLTEAIVDFWSSDWSRLAKQLRDGTAGLKPDLFERPILKMGQTLVQLPWVVGLQNNSTAAINNLRRLGARRGEFRAETQRIETQLGAMLAARGFKVVLNWNPPVGPDGNAGEVDVICARDGTVLVLEVKSTYLRRSRQDAWQHETTTLRKAGLQIRRKVLAVQQALLDRSALAQQLDVPNSATDTTLHGWIVDTSIECDHQRFDGFLKVSLEELLIALRDDRHLLHDPDGMFVQTAPATRAEPQSLYPQGFSAGRLMEVVETQAVWQGV